MGGAMLVVRRRVGETIVIGDTIEVTIVEISPTRVKLGVLAPREISVTRQETMAVAADNRRAAGFVGSGGVDGLLRILTRR
jgi:carbon storage regulator